MLVVACLSGWPRCDDKDAAVDGCGGARHAGLAVRRIGRGGRLGPGRLSERDDAQPGFNRGACAARPLPVPALLRRPARKKRALPRDPAIGHGDHAERLIAI